MTKYEKLFKAVAETVGTEEINLPEEVVEALGTKLSQYTVLVDHGNSGEELVGIPPEGFEVMGDTYSILMVEGGYTLTYLGRADEPSPAITAKKEPLSLTFDTFVASLNAELGKDIGFNSAHWGKLRTEKSVFVPCHVGDELKGNKTELKLGDFYFMLLFSTNGVSVSVSHEPNIEIKPEVLLKPLVLEPLKLVTSNEPVTRLRLTEWIHAMTNNLESMAGSSHGDVLRSFLDDSVEKVVGAPYSIEYKELEQAVIVITVNTPEGILGTPIAYLEFRAVFNNARFGLIERIGACVGIQEGAPIELESDEEEELGITEQELEDMTMLLDETPQEEVVFPEDSHKLADLEKELHRISYDSFLQAFDEMDLFQFVATHHSLLIWNGEYGELFKRYIVENLETFLVADHNNLTHPVQLTGNYDDKVVVFRFKDGEIKVAEAVFS